jgi:pimeloyl-ACP methyl ester carboxylesterase
MTTSSIAFEPAQFVDVHGLRLAYRTWGAPQAPPVLLVHGITSSSLSWARVGPALGAQYRVVAVDLKGHGDCDRPPAGYRLEDQAAEVAQVAGALGIDRARVIGHSWGGAIAVHLATSAGLVERLVLEDPSIVMTPERAATVGAGYAAQMGLPPAEAQAQAPQLRRPGWTDVDVAGKVDAMIKGSADAVRAVFAGGGWDVRPLYRRIACPTLLLLAEPALGSIVPPDVLAEVRAAQPSMQVTTIPQADHNVHRTQFEAFLAAVELFLAARDT